MLVFYGLILSLCCHGCREFSLFPYIVLFYCYWNSVDDCSSFVGMFDSVLLGVHLSISFSRFCSFYQSYFAVTFFDLQQSLYVALV